MALKLKKNQKNDFLMIKGYTEMAIINTELSREGFIAENEALCHYERNLSESESCDCKKRRNLLR